MEPEEEAQASGTAVSDLSLPQATSSTMLTAAITTQGVLVSKGKGRQIDSYTQNISDNKAGSP